MSAPHPAHIRATTGAATAGVHPGAVQVPANTPLAAAECSPAPGGTPADGGRRAYALNNADTHARDHHRLLAALLDPGTQARISDLIDLDGARCLEVGAGGGSIAVWLAERVGPAGWVTALDIDPRHIPTHPRMLVLRHDLTVEAPPAGPFDLIHARLVLNHLPARQRVLAGLVSVLAPGGVLLVEDWEATATDIALDHPDRHIPPLINQVQAVLGRVFEKAGTDRAWARQTPAVMRRAGLVRVHTDIRADTWTGDSPGARLIAGSLRQLRPQLLAAGLSPTHLQQAHTALHDPRLLLVGHPMWSTTGTRPDPEASGILP